MAGRQPCRTGSRFALPNLCLSVSICVPLLSQLPDGALTVTSAGHESDRTTNEEAARGPEDFAK
jgi:hypothetical protein